MGEDDCRVDIEYLLLYKSKGGLLTSSLVPFLFLVATNKHNTNNGYFGACLSAAITVYQICCLLVTVLHNNGRAVVCRLLK